MNWLLPNLAIFIVDKMFWIKEAAIFCLFWIDLLWKCGLCNRDERERNGRENVFESLEDAAVCVGRKVQKQVGVLGGGYKLLWKPLAAYNLSRLVAQAGLMPSCKENPRESCENVRLSPLKIPWGEAYFIHCTSVSPPQLCCPKGNLPPLERAWQRSIVCPGTHWSWMSEK